MLRARPLPSEATLEEVRARFENVAGLLPVARGSCREPVEDGRVRGEWVSTPGAAADGAVLYLHGGAYTLGSLATHRGLVSRIARAAGVRVLSLDYRLAPEHPFPAAVDDAVAAYRWLLRSGLAPHRLVVGGDSAGGGLTLATLLSLRDAGEPLPAGAVCLSPWVDLEVTGPSMTANAARDPIVHREGALRLAAAYLGTTSARHPLASPLHADLSGLPPLLIHVGTAEALLDDAARLFERARQAGVEVTYEAWPDMIHVWHFFAPLLPEARQALEKVGAFIRERLGLQ
jgi:epsilon-lactone hydrolase